MITDQFCTDIIKQIGLGVNTSRIYPQGHPSMVPIIQRIKILLKEVPLGTDELSVIIVEGVIMIEDQRFDSRRLPIVKSLVDRFDQLEVRSITFNVDVSDEDLKAFFSAMAATPADIADYGDVTALMRAKGVVGIKINKFRVGVVSSDHEVTDINWDSFLESIVISGKAMTDGQRVQELGSFLTGVGVLNTDPVEAQTTKVVSGLERLALMVADRYGEERWGEYSLVFSRILAALSPTIKKNIINYRTENKKLATLFRNLIPGMADEDIIEIIAAKARDKGGSAEDEIVDILKNVTGTRLPGILTSLRVNVPHLDFEKIVSRLMSELKDSKGSSEADAFAEKNLEAEMRRSFPRLRDPTESARINAITNLMESVEPLFKGKHDDLIRLLVDRLDTMADTEEELTVFRKIADTLRLLYQTAVRHNNQPLVDFISKKLGRHLIRKEGGFLDKKRVIIGLISDIKDKDYVPELISLLWDPGTFTEARTALVSLSEAALPMLVSTLTEADDRAVRMKIIDVLIHFGPKVIPEVRKLLQSSEWFVRRNAVYILGEMHEPSIYPELGAMLTDAKEQVQLAVIDALAPAVADDKVRAIIVKALDSSFRSVVLAATKHLNHADVAPKIPMMLEWLRNRRSIPDEKDERVRRDIINTLQHVADDRVVAALAAIIDERAFLKSDILLSTKEAALNCLLAIGSDKARSVLRSAVNHKDQNVAFIARELLKRAEMRGM